MTTRMSFYIERGQLDETKRIIRSLDSLRFNYNPFQLSSGKYNLSVSGRVEDINRLNEHLEKYKQRDLPKQPQRKGLGGYVMRLLKRD